MVPIRADKPANREIVAAVLAHRDQICLLRRSQHVSSDRGRWHCVTGYLDLAYDPAQQARLEILEETGLAANDLVKFRTGPKLTLPDGEDRDWHVSTYWVEVASAEIHLNWEHDSYRWIGNDDRFPSRTVSWLSLVLDAVGWT